jgi:PAS domain S-box-containing protein
MEELERMVAARTSELEETNHELQTEVEEHKRAEESIRASQASMADAQRIAHLGSWELFLTRANDIDANTLRWSDEMFRIAGYEPGDVAVSKEFFFSLVPEIEQEPIRQAVSTAIRERRPYAIVHRLIRADGEVRVVHEEAQVFFDEKTGQPLRIVGTAHDITERTQAEESLKLFKSAVEQAKESILITDAELDLPGPRIIFVNPAFTKMTGFTAGEVYGKTPRILQGPRTDRMVLNRLRKNLERGEEFEGEIINNRKDGEEFILEWRIAPIRNASGKITHFVSIQRDISARKKMEITLRESDRRFSDMLRNLELVAMMLDRDARITYCNDYLLRLTGWRREEVIGRDWIELFMPPELAGEVKGFFSVLLTDQPVAWHHENFNFNPIRRAAAYPLEQLGAAFCVRRCDRHSEHW